MAKGKKRRDCEILHKNEENSIFGIAKDMIPSPVAETAYSDPEKLALLLDPASYLSMNYAIDTLELQRGAQMLIKKTGFVFILFYFFF